MIDWRAAFLAAGESRRIAKKTMNSHRRVTRVFDDFLAARGESIDACTSLAIDDFTSSLLNQQMSATSVRVYVGLAHLYVDWCREHGAALPVMVRVRLPRAKYKMPSVLREGDLDEWLRGVRELPKPYAAALALLPAFGLRVEEHTSLRMSDLDISRDEQGPLVKARVEGKSKRERMVPMLAFGYPLLGAYLRDERPLLVGDEWLFPNRRGNPIRPERVERYARQLRRRLGKEDLTPHTLRHTYATILAENGVKPFELAQIMGHEDVKTTTIYVHPESDRVARHVRQIDYHGRTT